MNSDWIKLIYELIGGLALFLFGMDVMTRALKSSAGNQLKSFLSRMTSNRWRALLAGAGITAIIQSSSVTTVLAVGFVSAGLMTFESTLGLILGAGIGTTITAQIIAFKVTKIALLLVIIGYLFTLVSKKEKYHDLGRILVGLGLIFLGMNFMSEGMHPLRSYPPFLELMQSISNPAIGILIGALFTALVQSSSATTGVVIVMASQGLITCEGGISIVIGANIGTCVTAFLSAIGNPRAAMQVAIAHITFKVIGALIWVWLIPQLAGITELITPNDLPRQIANAHTIFNVVNAALLIGLISPIGWIITKLYPIRKDDSEQEILLLDKYYLQNTSMAIDLVDQELQKLSEKTFSILNKGLETTFSGSDNDLEQLRFSDKKIDFHQKQILTYLQQIQQQKLNKKEPVRIKKQMEIANLLEAAADMVTTDMVEAADHRLKHNFYIREETHRRFTIIYESSILAVKNAVDAYLMQNKTLANEVLLTKKEIRKNTIELKDRLAQRLAKSDENRVSIIRFETEIIELTGRIYALARRIARVQLE